MGKSPCGPAVDSRGTHGLWLAPGRKVPHWAMTFFAEPFCQPAYHQPKSHPAYFVLTAWDQMDSRLLEKRKASHLRRRRNISSCWIMSPMFRLPPAVCPKCMTARSARNLQSLSSSYFPQLKCIGTLSDSQCNGNMFHSWTWQRARACVGR